MCKCNNVDFGTYKRQVGMVNPFGVKRPIVDIDICISQQIAELWHEGIETYNSCCGHNKVLPSVIVSEESHKKMKELGYERCLSLGETDCSEFYCYFI